MEITGWDKWQTYRKDRGTPPWIKIYRNLLSNQEWVSLSDSEKGQLVSLWILAADKKGVIPDDPKILQRMCMLSTVPNIRKFKDLGFMVTNRLPSGYQKDTDCPQVDAPETETETETETEKKKKHKKKKYGKFNNVLLTEKEYSKLYDRFQVEAEEKIENISEYLASKGDKYKSHYATILSWERKDKPTNRNTGVVL